MPACKIPSVGAAGLMAQSFCRGQTNQCAIRCSTRVSVVTIIDFVRMKKISILSAVFFTFTVYVGKFEVVLAGTNCDDQAKPALGCPPAYSVMWISAGGDHWGCGKELNGIIVDAPSLEEAQNGPAVSDEAEVSVSEEGNGEKEVQRGEEAEFRESEEIGNSDSDGENASEGEIKLEDIDINIDADELRNAVAEGTDQVFGFDPRTKELLFGPADFETPEVLREYAKALSLQDQNIVDIAVNDETVKVSYKQQAKLFWLFPFEITVSVTVYNDGRIDVKFPWWHVFASTNRRAIEGAVEGAFNLNEGGGQKVKNIQEQVNFAQRNLETLVNIFRNYHVVSGNGAQNAQ